MGDRIVKARFILCNLTSLMGCHAEPSEEPSLETVWQRAGSCRNYLLGDWMNHPSIKLFRIGSGDEQKKVVCVSSNEKIYW